ncbi:MAG: hypothetical protein ACO3CQ_00680 [Candidatus Nanopelagicaceae bacterium]|jgi:hypothetical protein
MELNMGTIATSLIGAAIIGGVTSFWGLQQKTTIQEQKIIQMERTLQEMKDDSDKQQEMMMEILREVKK